MSSRNALCRPQHRRNHAGIPVDRSPSCERYLSSAAVVEEAEVPVEVTRDKEQGKSQASGILRVAATSGGVPMGPSHTMDPRQTPLRFARSTSLRAAVAAT